MKLKSKKVPKQFAYVAAWVAESIYRLMKISKEPKIQRIPIAVICQSTTLDISKAKRILGYNPQTKIEAGVEKLINWYNQEK